MAYAPTGHTGMVSPYEFRKHNGQWQRRHIKTGMWETCRPVDEHVTMWEGRQQVTVVKSRIMWVPA